MSVRMAIAQLCACACGGAAVGGGVVHYVSHHPRVVHARLHRMVPPHRVTAACLPDPGVSAAAVRSVLAVPIASN